MLLFNVMTPAMERSLSAAPLAPGKAIVVQDTEQKKGFRSETELFFHLRVGLSTAVCVGQLVLFVTVGVHRSPLLSLVSG